MKKSRFTEEQIAYALKQVELSMAVSEVCREASCNGYLLATAAAMAAWKQREHQWLAAPVSAQGRGSLHGQPGVSQPCSVVDEYPTASDAGLEDTCRGH
jgi:hypothetical protein